MSGWRYKESNMRVPAAREVRMLTEPCKAFLRSCTGGQLMDEIRQMLGDEPIEIVDAISMLDFLCELRDYRQRDSLDRAVHSNVMAELSKDAVASAHKICMNKGLSKSAKVIERMAQALGLL